MFEEPKIIQNIFSIAFSKQTNIRRRAELFEDRLRDRYIEPLILPVSDELNPDIARIIFSSRNGYSQIQFSQIYTSLQVSYSSDWQTDIPKIKLYLEERAELLFELIRLLPDATPFYCGLHTQARVRSSKEDNEILEYLVRQLSPEVEVSNLYDYQIRLTRVEEGLYFNNLQASNYRQSQATDTNQSDFIHVPSSAISERGFSVSGDFNDRYQYNEDTNYRTNFETARNIIKQGLETTLTFTKQLLQNH
ncbi:MAG: hypothetical protein KIT45_13890 [Fimbriimonadia bacterium]|nr:hypothetical protein [Fimbriimonadia bacterium]